MATTRPKTLSVRIDRKKVDDLSAYTRDRRGISQAKVVESLIGYFLKLNEEQQHLILIGEASDYLGLLGPALELITWADHAYSRPTISLPWAIELYGQLDKKFAEAQESIRDSESTKNQVGVFSLRRIALFKISNAWMDLAMRLRARALSKLGANFKHESPRANTAKASESKPDKWHELYNAALESLRIAIAYHRLFNKDREEKKKTLQPAVLYNQACAWALVAQYVSEKNASNEDLKSMAQHELQQQEKERQPANEQDSEKCLPLADTVEANNAIQRATDCLSDIKNNYRVDTDGIPMADTNWLVDFAEHDSDLACVRQGNGAFFKKWLTERKSTTSLLDSFKRLRRELPKDVEELID